VSYFVVFYLIKNHRCFHYVVLRKLGKTKIKLERKGVGGNHFGNILYIDILIYVYNVDIWFIYMHIQERNTLYIDI
jgi:hypothetical protein